MKFTPKILIMSLVLSSALIVGNMSFLHNGVLGVFSFLIWMMVSIVILHYRSGDIGQRWLFIFGLFLAAFFSALLAVYFFRLPDSIVTLIVIALTAIIFIIGYRYHNAHSATKQINLSSTRAGLMIWALVASLAALMTFECWSFFHIGQMGHHYHGFLQSLLPDFFLGAIFLCLWYIAIRIKSSIGWLVLLAITVVIFQSVIIFSQDSLFGADSWRHAAIINHINQGQPYLPTNPIDLLKLGTEKVPNALFYTTISILTRITQVSAVDIQRLFFFLFLGPMSIFVIFQATRDIGASPLTARIISFIAVLTPAYAGSESVTNPRSIGMLLLLLTGWAWLRYLHDGKNHWWIWIITTVGILAYPTTGYYCGAVAAVCIITQYISSRKSTAPSLVLVIPLGILFSIPITLLDIVRSSQLSQANAHFEWWNIFQIARNWTQSTFDPSRPWTFLTFGLALLGLFRLYRKKNKSGFVLSAIMTVALLINLWNLSIFQESYVPFTSRTPIILSLVISLLVGLAVSHQLKTYVEKRMKWHIIALGLLVSVLGMQATSLRAINFGWSPSKNEIQAVKIIENDAQGKPYAVIADETTAAVGYAITQSQTKYYWYPNTLLSTKVTPFVVQPKVSILQSTCAIIPGTKLVYFIVSPIPPTGDYWPKDEAIISKMMQEVVPVRQGVGVFRYSCPSLLSS